MPQSRNPVFEQLRFKAACLSDRQQKRREIVMPFGLGAPTFPHSLLQVACGYEAGVSQLASVTPKRINQSVGLPTRTDLRVCPDTSGRIAEFSEHEAD